MYFWLRNHSSGKWMISRLYFSMSLKQRNVSCVTLSCIMQLFSFVLVLHALVFSHFPAASFELFVSCGFWHMLYYDNGTVFSWRALSFISGHAEPLRDPLATVRFKLRLKPPSNPHLKQSVRSLLLPFNSFQAVCGWQTRTRTHSLTHTQMSEVCSCHVPSVKKVHITTHVKVTSLLYYINWAQRTCVC